MTRKKNRNNKRKSKESFQEKYKKLSQKLLNLLDRDPSKGFTQRQIFSILRISQPAERKQMKVMLEKLMKQGIIYDDDKGKFRSRTKVETYTGTVDFVSRDYAYILCEELEDDVWVAANDLEQAFHGDTVEVNVYTSKLQRGRLRGKVSKLLQRAKTEFVGTLILHEKFAFVECDNRKMHYDFFIPLKETKGAKDRDKVLVLLTAWDKKDKNPKGIISKILGKSGEHQTEMNAIMFEYALPEHFSENVEKDAAKISSKISKEEISKRRDLRDVTTFTIDPLTAKDFDDALSIEKLENGNWEIGVHIADVTHYVQLGSIVEKEALKRATSVYLVDRVIPMLPEKLSNELCSLRPNEDKLTFSAVFELDKDARVVNKWFGRTVIHSDRRFTYEEAQERIDTKKGDFVEEIIVLNTLAKKMQKKRFENGAITFETVEVRFELDEKGKPVKVVPKVRVDAHKLIEEFMLLANRLVAKYVYTLKKGGGTNTMVYRQHDDPDPEKYRELVNTAKRFGYELSSDPDNLSKSINKMTAESEGKPEYDFLQQLAIRTMSKAVYGTKQSGHFGLGFDHYTHFTSPIRRYPDMMVHRLLQHYLDGKNSPNSTEYDKMCLHSSEKEKKAAEAERASIKYKQVEYITQFIDYDFEGVITGATEWGLYVLMPEVACEGMIRLADIEGDYFVYDAKTHSVTGNNSKKTYTLGGKVQVRVRDTDIERRTINLSLIS
jgi:ribonuclease R